MSVVISLLRAVNLGQHNPIRMEALRTVYESVGLENPQTYIQSGNVIFRTGEKNLARVAARIAQEIERTLSVRTDVILRTVSEFADVIARNPFAGRPDISPNKLVVTFLAKDPGEQAQENIRKLNTGPEELHLDGRELYINFVNGIGRSRLQPSVIDRAIKVPGTARNWNTVMKLFELASKWEPAG